MDLGAFINILKNCVEHTLDQGTIRIEYGQNPIYTQILIEDGAAASPKRIFPICLTDSTAENTQRKTAPASGLLFPG